MKTLCAALLFSAADAGWQFAPASPHPDRGKQFFSFDRLE
jgi:hypothetical protein